MGTLSRWLGAACCACGLLLCSSFTAQATAGSTTAEVAQHPAERPVTIGGSAVAGQEDPTRKVGETAVDLDGEIAHVRTRETNLGNLVADALLQHSRADGATIAVLNGGSIRVSVPAGDVTAGQLDAMFPFTNTIATLDLSGAQVLEMLEHSVSAVADQHGRFLQVAGLRFVWQPDAAVWKRVTHVDVVTASGWRPLDLTATYRIVTNDYLAGGGDDYAVLTAGTNARQTNALVTNALSAYLAARSPVSPRVEGRIVEGSRAPTVLPRTGIPGAPLDLLLLGAGAALASGALLRRSACRTPSAASSRERTKQA